MNETLVSAIAAIIGYLGPTPILFFLAIMGLAPFAAIVWIVWRLPKLVNKISSKQETDTNAILRKQDERMQHIFDRQDEQMRSVFERQDKRFEQVVQMYRDNVELVKDYEHHVVSQRDTEDKLIELVSVITSTQQTLVDYIKNNWWCPVAKDPGFLNFVRERKTS